VAIFSSVVHLGSNPALIGFFFRPQHENPKDTYLNIKSSGFYTINQVHTRFTENAHFTSAKFPKDVSEFERCGLKEEYLFGFYAPFVKESHLKMGLEMIEEIPIRANDTILIVGKILHLQFPDHVMDQGGNLDLESMESVGISGVNTYYTLRKNNQFPYAHVEDVPNFRTR
jgi:flavin reductase (DIM6/NTAB) family NADH-FMN oxidoreductase RutF